MALLEPRTVRSDRAFFDVTNRVARIWYLKGLYWRLIVHGLHKIGLSEMIRTQFPYILRDAPLPPSLDVEFTNHCQLQCTYCTSPLRLRPQGFMPCETFQALVEQLRRFGARRIRVVGNGEPTLHPDFPVMMRMLREVACYLELKSNWQRVTDDAIDAVLSSADVVRVSVDSDSVAAYEGVRIGGSFEVLLDNLQRLMARRSRTRSRCLIVTTVMLRPSDRLQEQRIQKFWQPYCDVVSKQYVLDVSGAEPDAYLAATHEDFPRCSLPFKEMKVFWDGRVPLCKYSHLQTRDRIGVLLGNIKTDSLADLWQHTVMQQYRRGHRTRRPDLMPVCRGCIGT